MTNETRGQLPRRSFLTSAVAVAAGSMLAGGAMLSGAPSASAATGANVTWRITGEPADDRRGYARMLRGVTDAISDHQTRTLDQGVEVGHPVDVTQSSGANAYITIDLHAEDRPEFIRVFLRRLDAYVVGWFPGTEDGGGVVTLGDFFPLEPNLTNGQGGIPQGRARLTNGPDDPGSITNRRYENLAGYDALRGQGATRDNMQISVQSLNDAVLRLHAGDSSLVGYVRIAAASILQVIVGVSEAARFRNQAAGTIEAFRTGQAYTVPPQHIEQHNNWLRMSETYLDAFLRGLPVLSATLTIGSVVYRLARELARDLNLAHHASKDTYSHPRSHRDELLEGGTLLVAANGTGDHWTVQEAINAADSSGANTIVIDTGVYHEILSVPKDRTGLTIEGVSGQRSDVVIYNTRCNGMINPATGLKYGTQGSAVATFRPANLTVRHLTISNTFDRNAHPEISPYETQAVAVAAMGDRQVYHNVAIMSHQDTLLVKGETSTTQARQYFVNCFIRGDVDFIFGNATAVVALSTIQVLPWPNGTILAPNTDYSKKYGILLDSCTITTSGVSNDTMHLGRPWNNTEDAWPQAVVRSCDIGAGIKDAQPWTDMLPDQPWRLFGRFREYHNFGPGAGHGSESPQLTDAEAAEYTAQKYLAGTDGWNPLGF
ncbi:pectinesterase family protein [Streptomyces sp. SP18BB07]|uniref:pectinesterase family protein n=1 Tax=Streptomyces sp. SP18BB07 TaxID=3002522 RepID=UPI002E78ED85|nr:pectinesterase family protein [Streptomyces sp. SP18BB07]MEE1765203.1 pectinesterase family protein [Streptomyces sp. SP18BB07]